MEVSAFSTALCPSSGSSSLVKRGTRSLSSHQSHLFVSPIRTTTSRSLVYRIRVPFTKPNRFKVLSLRKSETPPVLEARRIEDIYDTLAERLLSVVTTPSNTNSKYIVGLAGSPGAGKSTVASEVTRRINMIWPQKASGVDLPLDPPDVAAVIPMDGFHLYRHQLDAMQNPEEAHARRGAPWTFDPARLLACLQTLRTEGSVYVPSFDHGVGDPVEDEIFVTLQHKIVIVEGNYLLLDDGIWKEVSSVFDEKWFIEVDIETAMQRVLNRHISTAGKPPDIAKWRIEYNDRPNAELVNKSKEKADLVIRSVDFSR